MFDVVAWINETYSSVSTQLLRVTVNHKQTHFILDRHDARSQLVVLALLNTGVVHLDDTISFQQSRALGRRSGRHLTKMCKVATENFVQTTKSIEWEFVVFLHFEPVTVIPRLADKWPAQL